MGKHDCSMYRPDISPTEALRRIEATGVRVEGVCIERALVTHWVRGPKGLEQKQTTETRSTLRVSLHGRNQKCEGQARLLRQALETALVGLKRTGAATTEGDATEVVPTVGNKEIQ